jgi:hypothetical protein
MLPAAAQAEFGGGSAALSIAAVDTAQQDAAGVATISVVGPSLTIVSVRQLSPSLPESALLARDSALTHVSRNELLLARLARHIRAANHESPRTVASDSVDSTPTNGETLDALDRVFAGIERQRLRDRR